MNKKVKYGITFTAGLGLAALLRSSWERKSFVNGNYVIRDYKIASQFTLVFLSDLHSAVYGDNNAALIQAVLDKKPDAVIIGGDMMVTKPGKKPDFSALTALLEGLKGLPVYYCEGNHEQRMKLYPDKYKGWWKKLKAIIDYYGVPYLLDDSVMLRDDILLSGLYIDKEYYTKLIKRKMPDSYVTKHIPQLNDKSDLRFRILAAHAPQYMESYWKGGADLVLSGHFHGGVMVLPYLGPVISPQFNVFPRYARGIYTDKRFKKYGIVSAGLGTHSINIRLFNRPELITVNLLPEEE